jgi:hypothetical protein
MLVHLGQVSRRKREDADAMLVEVCSTLRQTSGIKKTEGALSRFERGETVPNYLDEVMEAYAEVTGRPATEFWSEALKEWGKARKLSANGKRLTEPGEPILPGPLPGASDHPTTEPAPAEGESDEEGREQESA